MKRLLRSVGSFLALSLSIIFALTGCGKQNSSEPTINLVGTWEEKDKADTYHEASISGDTIEISWIMDDGETKALYWSGSYAAPPDGQTGSYTWDSVNDKDKTGAALLASGDDTKTFTYKDGELTYEASAMGVTKTVHLVQTSAEPPSGPAEAAPAEESPGPHDNETLPGSEEAAVDAGKVDLADMMEIQEYHCNVDDSFVYYVMYITNNSDKVVSLDLNVTAFDQSGAMVGSGNDSTRAVDVGQTAGLWTTFDEWDKINSFDYTLSVSEETGFSPVYNDLSIDHNITDTGIVAAVTNNGEDAASFVWMDVVYLKDGEMVNFSELSFMNDDQELPAGTTLSAEGECYYSDFDEVAIAVNGRR